MWNMQDNSRRISSSATDRSSSRAGSGYHLLELERHCLVCVCVVEALQLPSVRNPFQKRTTRFTGGAD
jgi:hypothetical protein